MEMQHFDRRNIGAVYQESEQIYKKLSSAVSTLKDIHKQAKREIQKKQSSIASEALEHQPHMSLQGLISKTDIDLDSLSEESRATILKELYIERQNNEMVQSLKAPDLLEKYKHKRKDFPNPLRFRRLAWLMTGQKKKQVLLKQVEEVKQLNETYGLMVKKFASEVIPMLEQPDSNLEEDFRENKADYYDRLRQLHEVERAKISFDDFKTHTSDYEALEKFRDNVQRSMQLKWENFYEIKKLLEKINNEAIAKEMKATSLDEFKQLYPDPGLRLDQLAKAGLTTVGEMAERPSFRYIDGIGEVTNAHIQSAISHYKDEINQAISLRFDSAERPALHTKILRNLYGKVNHKEVVKEIERIQLQFKQIRFDQLLADVLILSEWAMQQLAKQPTLFEEHNQKMIKLKDFVDRSTPGVAAYLQMMKDTRQLSEEEVWSNFNAQAADYYALLERDYGIGTTAAEDTIKRSGLSKDIIDNIKAFELNEDGLNATLRSWQDFGTKYALLQKKVLIGDEMGLGKTLISIAAMTHLWMEEERDKFLVICPASLMVNWERELKKFSALDVFIAHGAKRDFILDEWKLQGGVAITTYETAQRLDFDALDIITVDEAHYIKNPGAKRTRRVRELTEMSDYALYLTGTPLENKVSEMTQLIRPLNQEIAQYIRRPRVSINSEEYRKKIAPVYLRRTKKDVSLELPPLTQVEEWEGFGDEEFEEYKDAVANGKFMRMRRAAWTGGTVGRSPKLKRLMELCEEAVENESKVIVFTFFRDVIDTVVDTLGDLAVEPIHGDVPIAHRQEIIDEFRESKTKNVLVAQINTAAHGLNIQFANTIIFCEPQIKPSLETQAVARAYRMGQVDNVFVYRLLTVNSVDELMMEMLDNKQALFDRFADKSHLMEQVKEFKEGDVSEKGTESIQNKIISLESARLGIKPVMEEVEETSAEG